MSKSIVSKDIKFFSLRQEPREEYVSISDSLLGENPEFIPEPCDRNQETKKEITATLY